MPDTTLRGATVVITGASSGIGAAAARKAHGLGADVVIVGRTPDRTAAVARELGTAPIIADFARLADVRRTAGEILDRCGRIDVLVNNVGLSMDRRQLTEDGHEVTFQVNYLAPFLLTKLLLDRIVDSAPSRIITTASVAHLGGFVRMHDLEMRYLYVGPAAYAASKVEDILFTRELGRQLAGTDVLATCFDPGFVATDLGRGNLSGMIFRTPIRRLMKSPEQGADTMVWLMTAPVDDLRQGGYYSNRRLGLLNPQVYLNGLARQLWDRTEELVAVT